MIHFTEVAVKKVKEYAEAQEVSYSIRVLEKGGGCGGMQHDMYLDDKINDTDEVFEQDGIKIIVDMISLQYLDDTIIDFVESEFSSGFKFISDKIKGSCGCGKSVSY